MTWDHTFPTSKVTRHYEIQELCNKCLVLSRDHEVMTIQLEPFIYTFAISHHDLSVMMTAVSMRRNLRKAIL